MPDRVMHARLWHIQVGRVPLFLIDTDVEGNTPADRELTTRLYYSDLERRLQQEIILGIGGVRALRALGYNPAVWHMNEGHSAFSSLERLAEYVAGRRDVRAGAGRKCAPRRSSPRTRRCRPVTICSPSG